EGLAIGHWPHDDDRYSFEGWIDDVRLWVWDPEKDRDQLLDPCCLDRTRLDEIVRRVRREGYTSDALGGRLNDLLDLGAAIAIDARGGDALRTKRASSLARDALLGVKARDRALLEQAVTQY